MAGAIPTVRDDGRAMTTPRLDGIFGVKLPVRDLAASRAWYERLFDLQLRAEFPDDNGVVRGVAYEIPGMPGVGLALRERPDIAGLSGFDPVIFALSDNTVVDAWSRWLTELAVPHKVVPGTLGLAVVFHDPDGLEIHLYSREHHGLDLSGQAGYGRPVPQSPA